MVLGMVDVEMVDDCVINSIIYDNCNSYNKVRGCTLVLRTNSSCSVSCSSSNKSEELYMDQIQRESDSMVQDEPTTSSDSI